MRFLLKYSHSTTVKGEVVVQDAPGIQNARLLGNKEINPLNKEKKDNIMTNHILCSFLTFAIEVYMLLKLSFLIIIQYIMVLQVGSSMKKELTIAGSGRTL